VGVDARTAYDELRPAAGLRLGRRLFDEVLAHLVAAAPQEGVGLLAVEPSHDGTPARARHFFAGTNVDASRTRYTMDPAEVLAAFNLIAARGWRLGAIVHSHPATPPSPSTTDLREAHYPDALMVIVSLARGKPEMRAWRITPAVEGAGATATEVPIIIDEADR
jgi:proteasome lid subunit RPN8/RPN11